MSSVPLTSPSRRRFLQSSLVSGAALLTAGCVETPKRLPSSHVVVIGGGFGGATVAKNLRRLAPDIQVTLIEPKASYISCPASNWVLGGLASLSDLEHNYDKLSGFYGIRIIPQTVYDINPEKHKIKLADGSRLRYDKLVLSPGINFRWNFLSGYQQKLTQTIPHAWQAGPQTLLLKKQLQAMPNGGVVIITSPPNPFRCPPGPYERASLIAHYLKQHKPRSKLIILDAKTGFAKQSLFTALWQQEYGYGSPNSLIEWHSLTDNPLIELDAANKTLTTDFGDQFKADVLNIIPPQKAAELCELNGLTDRSGWCPINPLTAQAIDHDDIYIIGDASHHGPIPKSAFAANSEGKNCAINIIQTLNEQPPLPPNWINTCYSLVTSDIGISIAMVYRLNADNAIEAVPGAGGVTRSLDKDLLHKEAEHTRLWYQSIIRDSFY